MFGSEEYLNPHDIFIFQLPIISDRYAPIVQDHCDSEMYALGQSLISSIIFDDDFSYYESIEEHTLVYVLEVAVNDSLQAMCDNDTAYLEKLLIPFDGDRGSLGFAIYNHLYNYHVLILQHLPTIFAAARRKNVNYVDFNLSEATDSIVLRLNKGIGIYV